MTICLAPLERPYGLGIREASVLMYLKHVGTLREIGIAFLTIQRLFSTVISFILGIVFGMVLGLGTLTLNQLAIMNSENLKGEEK